MGAGDEGTKEFDASSAKLSKLREQGNVPKSPDLGQVASFITSVSLLLAGSGFIWNELSAMFINLLGATSHRTLEHVGSGFTIKNSAEVFAITVLPLLFLTGLSAIVGDILQVGLMVTPSQLGLKLDKLNPANYFKQLFSMKKVVEFLKQVLKVAVLVYVFHKCITKHWLELLTLSRAQSMTVVGSVLHEIIKDFTINAVVVLLIIAVLDYAFQKFKFKQDQRMTRKEMMDEYKQNEGDPHMKQQRRALARKYSQGHQLAAVATADFVTTNPSKIAIAITYKSGEMTAPKVVAKGTDAFAWQMIQVAKRNNVPVIENIPLARSLHKLVKLGAEVPAELYRAVADVLLAVYRLRQKDKTSAG